MNRIYQDLTHLRKSAADLFYKLLIRVIREDPRPISSLFGSAFLARIRKGHVSFFGFAARCAEWLRLSGKYPTSLRGYAAPGRRGY